MKKIIKIIIICTLLMVSVLSLMSCGTEVPPSVFYNSFDVFEKQTAIIEDGFVKLKIYIGIQYGDLTFEKAQDSDYGKIDKLRLYYQEQNKGLYFIYLMEIEEKLFSEKFMVDSSQALKANINILVPIEAFTKEKGTMRIQMDGYCGDTFIQGGVIAISISYEKVNVELILYSANEGECSFVEES